MHKSVCVTYVGVKSSAYKLSELTTMRSLDAIRRDFGSWVFGQMDIAESIPTFPGELINCNKEYGEHATNNEASFPFFISSLLDYIFSLPFFHCKFSTFCQSSGNSNERWQMVAQQTYFG